jgi:hypothetical protein
MLVVVKLKFVELRLAVTVPFVDVAVNCASPLKDVLPLLPFITVTVAVLVVATPNVAFAEFGAVAMGGVPLNVLAKAAWEVANRTPATVTARMVCAGIFIFLR